MSSVSLDSLQTPPTSSPRKESRRWVLGTRWMDCLFPWAPPSSAKEITDQKDRRQAERDAVKSRLEAADLATLTAALERVQSLLDDDDERRKGVDTRLGTIVGLTSIAATLATGLLIAQAAGTIHLPAGPLVWLIPCLALYLVAQLCIAIGWAIKGQSRGLYLHSTVLDLVYEPATETAEVDWLRERVTSIVEQLHANQEAVDQKVTKMAIAHRAILNFVWGLAVLSVLGLFAAFRAPDEASLMQAIRSNAELRALLRGPEGKAGPVGPPGPQGLQGARGAEGAPGISSTPCNCVPAKAAPTKAVATKH